MGLENNKFNGTFAILIADGSIRVKVEEGTPNAELREFELSDGTKGSKWELVYTELTGYITNLVFVDWTFGKSLKVAFIDKGNEIILSLGVASNFCEDFMKKLPNVDFSKEVKIVPYSFEDNKTHKLKKGITVYQDGNKISSFFADSEGKPINDFPALEEGKTMDKDDWKIYFINVRKFLVQYIEGVVAPKIGSNVVAMAKEQTVEEELDKMNLGEIYPDKAEDAKPVEAAPDVAA